MQDFIIIEDSDLWDVICQGPNVPIIANKLEETSQSIPKRRKDYTRAICHDPIYES